MRLARSLVLAGEVDEGAAEAIDTVATLDEVHSGRVMQCLTEVRDLLAGTDAASAQQAAAELTEYTRSQPQANA